MKILFETGTFGGEGLVRRQSSVTEYNMCLCVSRKDCVEDISDVKFSANGKMLAVGSHDNYIDM